MEERKYEVTVIARVKIQVDNCESVRAADRKALGRIRDLLDEPDVEVESGTIIVQAGERMRIARPFTEKYRVEEDHDGDE